MRCLTQRPSRNNSSVCLPHAEGPHMVTGRHFLQEDSGPEIARLVVDFLDRLGGV